jgi:hypothetical protein
MGYRAFYFLAVLPLCSIFFVLATGCVPPEYTRLGKLGFTGTESDWRNVTWGADGARDKGSGRLF